MSIVETRLAELGLHLPDIVPVLTASQPAVRSGMYVYTAGQLPMVDGRLPLTGKVGGEVSAEEAKQLAQTCVINALAAVRSVIGDLDKIVRVVKVVGFVASTPDFTDQSRVINGASELLDEILGEKCMHVRSAVGVAVLPLDAPVEVEIQVEIED